MTDEIVLGGKSYLSSKRAAAVSGYAQDYIGQLARAGLIEAQRVGGLWYISMDSLQNYRQQADTYKPEVPAAPQIQDPEAIVSFDGKDYISASRASKITGYNQDYIGQLARSGKILSRQIGNRWYVEREGLLAHKSQKDSLLGAVQSQSVGLKRPERASERPAALKETHETYQPTLTYFREDKDLMPVMTRDAEHAAQETAALGQDQNSNRIPIRVAEVQKPHVLAVQKQVIRNPHKKVRAPGKTMVRGAKAALVMTVMIVLSYGLVSLKDSSVYSSNFKDFGNRIAGVASVVAFSDIFETIGAYLEKIIIPELVYRRSGR